MGCSWSKPKMFVRVLYNLVDEGVKPRVIHSMSVDGAEYRVHRLLRDDVFQPMNNFNTRDLFAASGTFYVGRGWAMADRAQSGHFVSMPGAHVQFLHQEFYEYFDFLPEWYLDHMYTKVLQHMKMFVMTNVVFDFDVRIVEGDCAWRGG